MFKQVRPKVFHELKTSDILQVESSINEVRKRNKKQFIPQATLIDAIAQIILILYVIGSISRKLRQK